MREDPAIFSFRCVSVCLLVLIVLILDTRRRGCPCCVLFIDDETYTGNPFFSIRSHPGGTSCSWFGLQGGVTISSLGLAGWGGGGAWPSGYSRPRASSSGGKPHVGRAQVAAMRKGPHCDVFWVMMHGGPWVFRVKSCQVTSGHTSSVAERTAAPPTLRVAEGMVDR